MQTAGWTHYLSASLRILAAISPAVLAELHGGARDSGNKVVGAFLVANAITTAIDEGDHPSSVIDTDTMHPEVRALAHEIAKEDDGHQATSVPTG